VDWSQGAVAALADTSLAVRVSARGLHFFDHAVRPLAPPRPCPRAPDALCVLGEREVAFPEVDPPRYSLDRSDCGTASAGRVAVNRTGTYDLSVCDLLQAQADVIWSGGSLHVDRGLAVPTWAYILIALAVFFLVISLGQNIACIMGDELASTQPRLTEATCLALAALLLALHDPWRVWVAEHDRVMMVALICYVGLYLVRHACDMVMEHYVYTLNVITASLMLVTARLYLSFETPYATLFLLLLLTRFFHKLQPPDLNAMDHLTLTADALVIALHYRLAYRPSFWDPQDAAVYLSALLFLSLIVGILSSEQGGGATPPSQQPGAKPPPHAEHMHVRIAAPLHHQGGHLPALRAHGGKAGHDALRLDFLYR
jgi:hypothetical protein